MPFHVFITIHSDAWSQNHETWLRKDQPQGIEKNGSRTPTLDLAGKYSPTSVQGIGLLCDNVVSHDSLGSGHPGLASWITTS